MKIKLDFVTNSSSTCYVVVVPLDFEPDRKDLLKSPYLELEEKDKEEFFQDAEECCNNLRDGYHINETELGNNGAFYALKDLLILKDFIILKVETGPGGDDSMAGLTSEEITKAFMLTSNFEKIKETINRR